MACRTGCKTKDHASYAECLRAGRIQAAPVWTNSKAIHSELAAYAAARKEGIQPASTRRHDIEHAVQRSNEVGYAYDGLGGFKGLEID